MNIIIRIKKLLPGYLSGIFILFALIGMTSCMTGKSGFHDNPSKDNYRAFKKNVSHEVSPLTVASWLDASTTTGPYKIAPYIIVEAIACEPDMHKRKALVNYYIELYDKISSNEIPPLQESILYYSWNEARWPQRKAVKNYLDIYNGVVKNALMEALEKRKNKNQEVRYLCDLQILESHMK